MTASIRSIDVPGARLVAELEGDGPPLVLIHSALVNRRSWDALTPFLVRAGHRVVRYDARGFGESTTEDVAFSARDDLRAVLDALAIRQAAVVGNSMGGGNALDAAIETPDRFAALIWVAGGISGFEAEPTSEEAAAFRAMESAHDAGDLDAEAEWDTRIWVDGIGQSPTRVAPLIRQAVLEEDRKLIVPGRVFGTPKRLDPPANERLGDLAVPTLAIVGALDTPETRSAAQRLAKAAPNARLVTIPDVAHMVGMEVPGELARLIMDFLAPLPRWG
jgi:3-oxoadipate enol-lactonase